MSIAAHLDLGFLARELELSAHQIQQAVELLDDGNTVPFITRYRKDRTGGLNEQQIYRIQHELAKQRLLAERKVTILRSIEQQGKLTPELAAKINAARTIKWLEDVYLPYKPKKQTLATTARQRGLEPLANEVLNADPAALDLNARAASFITEEKGLTTVAEVLTGVGHILAEQFSERADLRGKLRRQMRRDGVLTCSRIEPSARAEAEEAAAEVAEASAAEDEPAVPVTELPSAAIATDATQPIEAGTEDEPEADDCIAEGHEEESPTASENEPEALAETAEPASDISAAPIATSGEAPHVEVPISMRPVKKPPSKKQLAKERKKKFLEHAFKDYYNFRESLSRVPPHRVLAINRGERAKVLRVRIDCDPEPMVVEATKQLIAEGHPHAAFLRECVQDSLARFLLPSLERDLRRELGDEAEEQAVRVFIRNLRKLLLQPPVRGKRVLAVDPGFRYGCKLAALDAFGNVLEQNTINSIGSEEQKVQSRATLADIVRRQKIDLLAIGNGAGCRAAELLVSETLANELAGMPLAYVIVNEAGTSVYSTSPIGREELPHCDAVLRSAVSIGRRVLDPLSEMVKINPANIGVGMYQHDMKAKHLRESLDAEVNSCVNFVGVDVNSASPSLLSYVSGLNQLTARRLYEHRQQHGPFRNREQIKDVPGIGEATFVQAAGFLRILDGDIALDATWIHPESYDIARRVLEKLGIGMEELASRPKTESATASSPTVVEVPPTVDCVTSVENAVPPIIVSEPTAESVVAPPLVATPITPTKPLLAERLASVSVPDLARELEVGELLLQDILATLAKPGRDPRDDFSPPAFRTGIMKLEDLKPSMELQATVLNVVDFGAFVDIGISDSALIHISKLADRFIRDPQEVVSVGDVLRVWVIGVDKDRRRVSLTAIDPTQSRPQRRGPPRPKAKLPTESGEPPTVAQPSGQQQRPPRPPHPQRPQRQPFKPKPRQSGPPPKPKPVRPITPGMLTGKTPMRSFSDLAQFYDKKKDEPDATK